MLFKIKNTTYKLSFSFLALLLLILTINNSRTVWFVLCSSLAHEMVHLIFIYHFSFAPKRVEFTLFGANITRDLITSSNPNSEIYINASAPVFNIIAGAVFYLSAKLKSEYQVFLTELSYINFILGFFNFIPFYTFDGGNVLKHLLYKHINVKTTSHILFLISVVITIIFSFTSIYIFFNYTHNYSLLLICLYMFLSIIFKKKNSLDY